MSSATQAIPSPPRLLTPERVRLTLQFLRFGVVGTLGFVWDAATVTVVAPWIGLVAAGFVSYFVAASMNWLLNRLWTFRGGSAQDGLLRQWAMFLAANLVGLVLNRGAFLALVLTQPLFHAHPVLAVAAGSLSGLLANFALSRRLVFRRA